MYSYGGLASLALCPSHIAVQSIGKPLYKGKPPRNLVVIQQQRPENLKLASVYAVGSDSALQPPSINLFSRLRLRSPAATCPIDTEHVSPAATSPIDTEHAGTAA